MERKTLWNPACLLPALPIDRRSLPPQIPLVLELRFYARDVDSGIPRIDYERQLTLIRERSEAHGGMLQRPCGRDALPRWDCNRRRAHGRRVSLEASATGVKALPALIVHKADRATAWRESKVRVVDPEKEPVLGPGREHPVGLETSLCREVVHEDSDIRLVAPEREWRPRRNRERR